MIRRPENYPCVSSRSSSWSSWAFIALYPIWFAVLAAGRKGDSLYTFNLAGMFFPVEWTWENFVRLFTEQPFWTWVANSLKVASITVVFAMVVVTSAAFAFSRFRFWGRNFGLTLMLGLQAYPGFAFPLGHHHDPDRHRSVR